MRLQTILNRVEKFKSFTYDEAHFEEQAGGPALVIQVLPRKNSRPYCSGCLRRGLPYDHLQEGCDRARAKDFGGNRTIIGPRGHSVPITNEPEA